MNPTAEHTIAELRAYAIEHGIDLVGAKTKAQILARIADIDEHIEERSDDDAVDAETLDVDTYEIPVVEDDTDDRFPAFIAGSTLIVRLEYPGEIRIPLKVTYKTLQELRAGVSQDADELEQLVFLLEKVGDAALVKTLTEDVDLGDATAIAVLFFRAWKQRTKVSLGKLRRSSRK